MIINVVFYMYEYMVKEFKKSYICIKLTHH